MISFFFLSINDDSTIIVCYARVDSGMSLISLQNIYDDTHYRGKTLILVADYSYAHCLILVKQFKIIVLFVSDPRVYAVYE